MRGFDRKRLAGALTAAATVSVLAATPALAVKTEKTELTITSTTTGNGMFGLEGDLEADRGCEGKRKVTMKFEAEDGSLRLVAEDRASARFGQFFLSAEPRADEFNAIVKVKAARVSKRVRCAPARAERPIQ